MGGIPELVREGRTGLLFAPGDAAALASAIAGLATGAICFPDLAGDTAALAEEHTLERMVEGYLGEDDAVVGSPKANHPDPLPEEGRGDLTRILTPTSGERAG